MSEPVHVTRAMLVALLEELGDTDHCGRAIIETAIRIGDELERLAAVSPVGYMANARKLLHDHEWSKP